LKLLLSCFLSRWGSLGWSVVLWGWLSGLLLFKCSVLLYGSI
jgi:hypothetical protein